MFRCAFYVPIALPQPSKLGPQRQLGIYVGFNSPFIIHYLEPVTGDVFIARFADCHFDENVFPLLGGDKSKNGKTLHGMYPPCLIFIPVQGNVN